MLGREMFVRPHGSSWEDFQREAVREVLADRGMQVWVAEAIGRPGHAPARHVYERAGYRLLPVARYFKEL